MFAFPSDENSELSKHAKESRKWLESAIEKQTFPREDYKELAELALIWLGGTLPGNRKFSFRKPGAFHAARFMSKAIYLLKIDMLSAEIEQDPEQRRLIHRMAIFIGVYYTKYFLRSRIASFAPQDDYKLFCQMNSFKAEDEEIANAVLESLSRHMWYFSISPYLVNFPVSYIFVYRYLTEELVVLSLFNESLSPYIRTVMAKKIFSTNRLQTFPITKPVFPKIAIDNIPELYDFIGPNSWLIFSLLKLDRNQDWMQLPSQYWDLMTDYRTARDFVRSLEVTNDCAERGVKIINDFKDVTEDEEQLQYALQVIEHHRRLVPSLTKENLNKQLFP